MLLIDLISKYIRLLKRERLHSDRTIISYKSDLKLFARFMGETTEIRFISETMVARYVKYLSEHRQTSNATISRRVCVLRGFFRSMEYEEYITRSPVTRLAFKTTVEKKTPVYITQKEIKLLFQAIGNEKTYLEKKLTAIRSRGDKDSLVEYQAVCNIRNELLFRIVLETGIRLSDLVLLPIDRFRFSGKHVKIYREDSANYFARVVEPETIIALRVYRRKVKQLKFDSPYFFFNRYGEQISTVMIQKIFRRYVKISAIKRLLTPSSLRHSFAINLIRQSLDINTIREKLGLKTFEGLSIYQEFFDRPGKRFK